MPSIYTIPTTFQTLNTTFTPLYRHFLNPAPLQIVRFSDASPCRGGRRFHRVGSQRQNLRSRQLQQPVQDVQLTDAVEIVRRIFVQGQQEFRVVVVNFPKRRKFALKSIGIAHCRRDLVVLRPVGILRHDPNMAHKLSILTKFV